MYGALKSSTIICTPSCSMTMSSGRRLSSKAIPYCMPEQPPPLTKIRSASCGLPSLASSSFKRDWASAVSETTASCSITPWMLPDGLASPELETLLGRLGLRPRRPCDQRRQRLRASRDRALRVGQDEDLPLHSG